MFNVARLLILDALVLYAQRDTESAIATLKRALALTEPENYARSFLDLGKPMKEFLSWSLDSKSLTEPHLRAYVSKLLSHFWRGYFGQIKPANRRCAHRAVEPARVRCVATYR